LTPLILVLNCISIGLLVRDVRKTHKMLSVFIQMYVEDRVAKIEKINPEGGAR